MESMLAFIPMIFLLEIIKIIDDIILFPTLQTKSTKYHAAKSSSDEMTMGTTVGLTSSNMPIKQIT